MECMHPGRSLTCIKDNRIPVIVTNQCSGVNPGKTLRCPLPLLLPLPFHSLRSRSP